jgi:RNA polymerase sigma-70 factor, ECF subfamily
MAVDREDAITMVTTSAEDSILGDLQAARSGDAEMLGRVLQSCRDYLLIVAMHGLGPDLMAKAGTSDVVQETLLGAYRDFDRFHGRSRGELLAWLRKILQNHLSVTRRAFRGTEKRAIAREISIDVMGDGALLPCDSPTPCALAHVWGGVT